MLCRMQPLPCTSKVCARPFALKWCSGPLIPSRYTLLHFGTNVHVLVFSLSPFVASWPGNARLKQSLRPIKRPCQWSRPALTCLAERFHWSVYFSTEVTSIGAITACLFWMA